MADIENELKLKNWLSILTFDAFKYAAAGGELVIEQGERGLVLALPGVDLSSEGINKKFSRLAREVTNSENEEPI